MNFDTALKKLTFRIGSEIALLSKEKYAPISKIKVKNHTPGTLKNDIWIRNLSYNSVTIGNTKSVYYAKFVHFGTGIYGAKKAKIRPKKARALKTPYGFKKSIKGQKANPYLNNAFDEYKKAGLKRALNSFAKALAKNLASDIKITMK